MAAKMRGIIFFSASTIAVLAKPQAVSPDAMMCVRRQLSTICFQRKAMSRAPRMPSANTTVRRSAFTSASSQISLPPVDSMASRSAPWAAEASNMRSMASQ